jgi:hypothetical protein
MYIYPENALTTIEQRLHERKILRADALIKRGQAWEHIHLLDVAKMGLAFTTDEITEVGAIREFDFALPGSLTRIKCSGKIVNRLVNRWPAHANQAAFRVGTVFIAIDQGHQAMIEAYVMAEMDEILR